MQVCDLLKRDSKTPKLATSEQTWSTACGNLLKISFLILETTVSRGTYLSVCFERMLMEKLFLKNL